MKRKQMLKKMAAMAAALVLTLAGTVSASAAKITQIDDESKVTIHMYGSNSTSSNVGTGTPGDQSGLPDSAKPLAGVTLKYAKVGDVVQYSKNGEVGIKYRLTDQTFVNALKITPDDNVTLEDGTTYIVPDTLLQARMTQYTLQENVDTLLSQLGNIPSMTETTKTDADGTVTLSSMKGLYVFIGGRMTEDVTSQVTPFLVSAPMPNLTGDGWNTDIHVYPKVANSPITMKKTASQGTRSGQEIVAASGEMIKYTVEIDLPGGQTTSAIADFTKFVIKDTMAEGLTPVRAKSKLTVVGQAHNQEEHFVSKAEKEEDLEIVIGPPNKDNNYTTIVTFTEKGLEKLNGILVGQSAKIELTYYTILGSGSSLGTIGNKNTASLEYQREATAEGKVETYATVYTYGIDLTKELSDGKAVEEGTVQFTLNRAVTGADGKETLEPISFWKGADNSYWMVGNSEDLNTAGANNQTTYASTESLDVAAGGKLKIYGLLPGTYKLVETKSAKGYSILKAPITLEIKEPATGTYATRNPAATADGSAMKTDGVNAYQLKVVNTAQTTGFSLPKTGGEGTLAALAVGFGLVGFAIVMLVYYRSKNKAAK